VKAARPVLRRAERRKALGLSDQSEREPADFRFASAETESGSPAVGSTAGRGGWWFVKGATTGGGPRASASRPLVGRR
jgi:hypothetical protein